VDLPALVSLGIAVMGLGGLVFSALRWRRDDTTAIIGQQDTLFAEMRGLNDELRLTADSLRSDRDKCYEEVAKLREMTQRIERKIDDG
jgi:uncharacterized coiled-coil DUF342 family protein